jgi:hypothetical protein
MFAIPSVPANAACPRLTVEQLPALTRGEERLAGAVLLAGIGAGVLGTDEVAKANASDHRAYVLGRLAGSVSERLRARATEDVRVGLGIELRDEGSCELGLTASAEPRMWALQGSDRALTLEGAERLPPPLIEQVQLGLNLIHRLLLPFLWPCDLGDAWMADDLSNEWADLAERCGSRDPEVVARWFAAEGEASGIEVYHFDASTVEGCAWAASVSALGEAPAAGSPLAPLYAMDHRLHPWVALARLEALSGRGERALLENEGVARWCAEVARVVRWHTGGARGASRMRRLERRCGYTEASEYSDDGFVPLCVGTMLLLGRAGEHELAQQVYEHRMEAGETPATVMRLSDPLGGGAVLYQKLRGALLGGALLDRLGNALAD